MWGFNSCREKEKSGLRDQGVDGSCRVLGVGDKDVRRTGFQDFGLGFGGCSFSLVNGYRLEVWKVGIDWRFSKWVSTDV